MRVAVISYTCVCRGVRASSSQAYKHLDQLHADKHALAYAHTTRTWSHRRSRIAQIHTTSSSSSSTSESESDDESADEFLTGDFYDDSDEPDMDMGRDSRLARLEAKRKARAQARLEKQLARENQESIKKYTKMIETIDLPDHRDVSMFDEDEVDTLFAAPHGQSALITHKHAAFV